MSSRNKDPKQGQGQKSPREQQPAGADDSKEHEHYKTYRDYLKHEDGLINNRLSWNFNIQGFLFASYSLSLQKIVEVKAKVVADLGPAALTDATLNTRLLAASGIAELRFVVYIIALVGLFVSFFVYMSVWAARIAIGSLEDKWLIENPDYRSAAWLKQNPAYRYERGNEKADSHGLRLPGIIGGGSHKAHGWGFQAPMALPIVFIIAWILLFCYALFS